MDLLGVHFLLKELKIPSDILIEDTLWSINLSNDILLPENQKRHIIFVFDKITILQEKIFKSLKNVIYFKTCEGTMDVVSFRAPKYMCRSVDYIYHKLKR